MYILVCLYSTLMSRVLVRLGLNVCMYVCIYVCMYEPSCPCVRMIILRAFVSVTGNTLLNRRSTYAPELQPSPAYVCSMCVVCMYVCIYVCKYVCIYVLKCIHIEVYMYCDCMYIYVMHVYLISFHHMYVCKYVCMYAIL